MSEPTIRITEYGIVEMNKATVSEFYSSELKFVDLYANEDEQTIGFKEIKEPNENSFRVNTIESDVYIDLEDSFERFKKYYDIDTDKKYNPKIDNPNEDLELVIIEL